MVPDNEYYAQRGIGADDDVTIPSSFDAVFDRFENADVRMRDQLLRACYWLDTASRVETSKSLSYVAAITLSRRSCRSRRPTRARPAPATAAPGQLRASADSSRPTPLALAVGVAQPVAGSGSRTAG